MQGWRALCWQHRRLRHERGRSGQRRLTRAPRDDFVPAWPPDGRKIAFVSKRDGNAEIYVMNTDGSEQRNLTRSPADDGLVAWSPVRTK